MYTSVVQGLDQENGSLKPEVYEAMFQVFSHICTYWENLDNPEAYRSRLYTFMDNRMALRSQYQQYYQIAKLAIEQEIVNTSEEAAYKRLFTDASLLTPHNNDPLAITRQKVSNEFINFQVSVGGFKGFKGVNEAKTNAESYIGGAYIPGQIAPYRVME